MASTPKTISMGVPNINDGSQPTAQEAMDDLERRAEEVRRAVQKDLGLGADERLRQDEDDRVREARDGDMDLIRGGNGRAYTEEDWSRSRAPTDPERRRFMSLRFNQAILPDLPQPKGLHRCWVSTTHQYDTPQWRLSMGYHFCSHEGLKQEGWNADQYAVKDARNMYAGCIMWREMIAMEINSRGFYDYMREVHHDQPYEQARQIYDTIVAAGDPVRSAGGRTTMAPGFDEMREFVRPPTQFTT